MNRIWVIAGKITYLIIYPILVLVIRFTKRTRVIVIYENKILVVKGWLSTGKWILPGGGLHRNELPSIGAKRELLEETNIKIDQELLHVVQQEYNSGLIKYQYDLFETKLVVIPKNIKKQNIEILEVKWMNIDEITSNDCSNELLEMVDIWKNKGKFAKIN